MKKMIMPSGEMLALSRKLRAFANRLDEAAMAKRKRQKVRSRRTRRINRSVAR